MADHFPDRITVELVSSADVKRLEARDDDLQQLIEQQNRRIEALHKTVYELMDLISRLKPRH